MVEKICFILCIIWFLKDFQPYAKCHNSCFSLACSSCGNSRWSSIIIYSFAIAKTQGQALRHCQYQCQCQFYHFHVINISLKPILRQENLYFQYFQLKFNFLFTNFMANKNIFVIFPSNVYNYIFVVMSGINQKWSPW